MEYYDFIGYVFLKFNHKKLRPIEALILFYIIKKSIFIPK
jgi:hypothetical protein